MELIVWAVVLVNGTFLSLMLLALWSRKKRPAAFGIINGRLAPCPGSPNCVCTEDDEQSIQVFTTADESWKELIEVIKAMGADIVKESEDYLHATFRGKRFGFVDDLEARLDHTNRLIRLRSSSRVGYSDLGANQSRIDAIKNWVES